MTLYINVALICMLSLKRHCSADTLCHLHHVHHSIEAIVTQTGLLYPFCRHLPVNDLVDLFLYAILIYGMCWLFY